MAVEETTATRRGWTKHRILVACIVTGSVAALLAGVPFGTVVGAAVMAFGIFWVGWAFLGTMARPIPPPPPPGELRQVRLLFRCSICGAEVRMTAAAEDDPEPPRHCQEDMELVAPTFE